MAFKTLTTVFQNPKLDQPHLLHTTELARAWNAHLDVLAIGTDHVHPSAFYAGAGAIAVRDGLDQAIEDANLAREAATEHLETTDVSWRIHAIVAQMGAMAQSVAQHTALSDLVVLPRPYGDGRGSEDVAITEAALFSTRTPILVLPSATGEAGKAERIVIAWNQSPEALAAIRAALPLLKSAQEVSIAIIDPPAHNAEQIDPGHQLAEMLTRHGVSCEIAVLARTMPNISDVLMRHALDINADMIVMGAYGHSRLREAILGGATRNMLEKCSLPVLMAH